MNSILPDYPSDILILQGEITRINARIDGINITGLQDRATTLESQGVINTKGIADIHTAYDFHISVIFLRSDRLEGWSD
jgi:hypothetical protein